MKKFSGPTVRRRCEWGRQRERGKSRESIIFSACLFFLKHAEAREAPFFSLTLTRCRFEVSETQTATWKTQATNGREVAGQEEDEVEVEAKADEKQEAETVCQRKLT